VNVRPMVHATGLRVHPNDDAEEPRDFRQACLSCLNETAMAARSPCGEGAPGNLGSGFV
jgi:hypothetical protein